MKKNKKYLVLLNYLIFLPFMGFLLIIIMRLLISLLLLIKYDIAFEFGIHDICLAGKAACIWFPLALGVWCYECFHYGIKIFGK
ncbi:hypothetical protein H3T61_08275 [Gilliamella sp. B14384H2]|uniref:hypothetical protein n=1 Tax=unclassified Gilliamella TaxID=2685620 RepID=UPI0018DCDB2A|nr:MULTISPECIES: hypothetical protein [unclassified Gilliamella]MBI0038223.1 hypothetical protein [Gilliamella sp. B14384G10]MBI0040218.1 hypothetical protein [Gilliamella sp. B14384G7]MBI0052058.1 hypothetical protein [Gilliamella sp. B14384G13]MBI0054510.1 hypothetical protein [Gilliamella sp. B14384H2]